MALGDQVEAGVVRDDTKLQAGKRIGPDELRVNLLQIERNNIAIATILKPLAHDDGC